MFQTVGHGVIEAVAECMELPLFRERLAGTARDQTLTYETGDGDEVEDLFRLLKRVKEAVPDVEAVASGAILSTYQRVRVEHVCSRLGLTSLAFLWHRDQHELLQEMVDSGMDAILVKICSMGALAPVPRRADPPVPGPAHTHSLHCGRAALCRPDRARPPWALHRRVATLPAAPGAAPARGTARRPDPPPGPGPGLPARGGAPQHERCGLNVCGEGGEYETFTLDLPLFTRRIAMCGRRGGQQESPKSVRPALIPSPATREAMRP